MMKENDDAREAAFDRYFAAYQAADTAQKNAIEEANAAKNRAVRAARETLEQDLAALAEKEN